MCVRTHCFIRFLLLQLSESLSCSDIQVMGTSATALTTTDISELDSTEFSDCVETLGAISDWDSDQLTSLASKAKAVSTCGFIIGSAISPHSNRFTHCLG